MPIWNPPRCEWNPAEDAPATTGRDHLGRRTYEGCPSDATLVVGTRDGAFFMCQSCADNPRWKRRKKRPLDRTPANSQPKSEED